ncbi:hypothetical protein M431DRAFT_11780 [Trichoderma harzianum CBS 226.95]|uniref:Uncharacterized protein n=1 Tax=Trichoderma harzianum CBS 226.95 TaxID=983964 RepID=A0A2T3ZRD9_TRIHA|nr:hypothetical protein M431DRAFT_11780 [Trichoderma harzianum CBS 226.95]PTB47377.1 hypothetical protein M431DRAFT_11780 [Trichoderma harzianum CBS 226.95]
MFSNEVVDDFDGGGGKLAGFWRLNPLSTPSSSRSVLDQAEAQYQDWILDAPDLPKAFRSLTGLAIVWLKKVLEA